MTRERRSFRLLLILGLLVCAGGLPWMLFTQTELPATPNPTLSPELPVTEPVRKLAIPMLREVLQREPEAITAPHEPQSHELSGRVLDALNAPIVGCRILIEERSEVSFASHQTEPIEAAARDRSDAQGRFLMHLDQAGPWVLTLVHPDYPPTIVHGDLYLDLDRPTDLGDLQLHSQVGLIVMVEGLSGTPVGAARLSLQPVLENPEFASRTQRALRRAAVSDASGRALFYGVSPGPYRLRVESAGMATVDRAHQQATRLQGPPLLRVKLSPGHALRGRLGDSAGAPVANAWVTLTPDDGSAGTQTRSAESGLFRLSGLSAGTHQLNVESVDHGSLELTHIQIPLAGGELELRFPPGLEIAGTILRMSDLQPVAGARIRLTKDSLWPEFRAGEVFAPKGLSDHQGAFHFGSLTSGRYRLEVASKGLFPETMSVLPEESAKPREILMREAFVLAGRLLDQDGRPLSGGLIEVMKGNYDGSEFSEFKMRILDRRREGMRAHSDPQGAFRIDAMQGGEYRLRLSARNMAKRLTPTFQSHAGQLLDLGDLAMAPAGRVQGQALLAKGEGAGQALVCLDPSAPSSPPSLCHQVRADESGHFRFDGISAGSYALFYYYPGEQSSGPSVDYRTRSLHRILIREGATKRQDLVLR